MTSEEFFAFYPQFAGVFPEPVTAAFVTAANLRFGDFLEDAEDARRLYTAHRLTLYARTMPAGTGQTAASWAGLASAGSGERITGKRVDDVAISYAAPASGGSDALTDLKETVFGLQLLTLLRLHGWPRYVP